MNNDWTNDARPLCCAWLAQLPRRIQGPTRHRSAFLGMAMLTGAEHRRQV